jgi:hypothetical protein
MFLNLRAMACLMPLQRLSRSEGWLLDGLLPVRRGRTMNLEIWLPAMFLLGLTVMGLCYGFLHACERI